MLSAIIVILGGSILAATIITLKPNAQDLLDKLPPFQGWFSVVLTFGGVWGIIHTFLTLNCIDLFGAIALINVVEFIVGLLLSYRLISKYLLEKNETAKAKGQALRTKLTI